MDSSPLSKTIDHFQAAFGIENQELEVDYGATDEDFRSLRSIDTDRRLKLFRLVNTIHQNPDDIDALEEYVELLLTSVEHADDSEILERCDQAEAFLLEQAQHVTDDYVEDVAALTNSLDTIRAIILHASEASTELSEQDKEAEEALEQWREDGLENDIPSNTPEVRQALELARSVHSLIQYRGGEGIHGLQAYIHRLQSALEIDQLLSEARSSIDGAANEDNATAAAYLLQSAEQVIRQLVTKRRVAEKERTERIGKTIRRFEETSNSVTEAQRKREDERLWNTLLERHSGLSEDFHMDALVNLPSGKAHRTGDRRFTRGIHKMERVLQDTNQTISQLQTDAYVSEAISTLDDVQGGIEKLQKRRHQAYNRYAMHTIRGALEEGEEETGTFGDKEKLADAVVKLGEINRQYLTREVDRCYSEVFETLYSNLKKAKSESDFEEKGRKLNALKRLHDVTPHPVEAF
jgi:hypothetical protein